MKTHGHVLAFIAMLLGTTLGLAQVAKATCTDLQIEADDISLNYDELDSPVEIKFSVTRKSNEGDCEFYAAFSLGKFRHGGWHRRIRNRGHFLRYRLMRSSGDSEDNDLTPAKGIGHRLRVLKGEFEDGGELQKEFSFFVKLKKLRRLYPRAGEFKDTFSISLFDGIPRKRNDEPPFQRTSIVIKVVVDKKLGLSIVRTGGEFDIFDQTEYMDFGLLERGEKKSCDVIVLRNLPYKIELKSENEGRMAHKNERVKTYIDYSLYFGSRLVSFESGPYVIETKLKHMDYVKTKYDRWPIAIQIGDVTKKSGGYYSDNIKVVVSSLE